MPVFVIFKLWKTVLFVPGFQEDMQARDYKSLLDAIEAKGYRTRFVSIEWKRTTIEEWVRELEAEYNTLNPKDTILAGFSYGSMVAFAAAAKRVPAALWLFSFSPYFSDDLPKLKKSWKSGIGHRRVSAFSKLDFNLLAKKVTCPTIVMLGSAEANRYPIMVNRARKAQKFIKYTRYLVVDGADHNIADKNYIAAITKAIG